MAHSSRVIALVGGRPGRHMCRWLFESYPDDLALVIVRDSEAFEDIVACGGRGVTVLLADDHSWLPVARERLALDPPTLGLLLWWPEILTAEELEISPAGFFNVHPSLLPQGRGSNPNFWAIVEETEYGVSLHRVTAAVDQGPVVAQLRLPIEWTDTGESLYRAAVSASVELFKSCYPRLRTDPEYLPGSVAQLSELPHRRIDMERASQLDLDAVMTVRQVLNVLRARTFSGHPAAWFEDRGARFEIRVEISRKPEGRVR